MLQITLELYNQKGVPTKIFLLPYVNIILKFYLSKNANLMQVKEFFA
jgi:hypothetical protein